MALLAIVSFCCGTTAAQAPKPADITGRVVDEKGAAVAQAQVWLIGGSWQEPKSVAATTTDNQGDSPFRVSGMNRSVAALSRRSRTRTAWLRATRAGRLGWMTVVYRGIKMPASIALAPLGEARGRVVDTAGKPVAGARIVPSVLTRSHAERSVQRLCSPHTRARRAPRHENRRRWLIHS